MDRLRLATLWLDGCSGCHMSLLDLDDKLVELAAVVDLVYSPLVDGKVFPEGVDAALVEGAVSSEEAVSHLRHVRGRTRTLVAFGDCAVTANVPAMRNQFRLADVMGRAYEENADGQVWIPGGAMPRLLEKVFPVHAIVTVDLFLPGCPPSSKAVLAVLGALLGGRPLDAAHLSRFGA